MKKPIATVRKSEIVEGAIAALEQHGLPFISLDLVAEQAGMTRQLIRHYFSDMDDLMVAMCERIAIEYRHLLVNLVTSNPSADRLTLFLDFFFDRLEGKGPKKPADDQVFDAMMALAVSSDGVRSNLLAQYTQLQLTITHEIQLAYPQLSPRAADELGYLFTAIMYGHWKMVASLGFSKDMNRVARQSIDRLIESYLARYEDPDEAFAALEALDAGGTEPPNKNEE